MRQVLRAHLLPALGLALALALAGCGGDETAPPRQGGAVRPPEATAEVQRRTILITEAAVGTVRPKTEISVAAQVMGRVAAVHVRPGSRVTRGQPLVELDAREFAARAQASVQSLAGARAGQAQAEQAVAAARAQADKARSTFQRLSALHGQGALAAEEMERARRDMLQADAALAQARDALTQAAAFARQSENLAQEASISEGYTVIAAPEAGEVVRRMAEPGDLAVPGKPLLLLQTGGGLWLEAAVREGLIARTPLGAGLSVVVDALGATLPGSVEEIVPSADPATRTFLVRVGLPPAEGLYQGMFGRLLIPVEAREAVLAPRAALRRTGQLAFVRVREGEVWRDIAVQPGRALGGEIEILAGLLGGETVGLFDAADAGSGGAPGREAGGN